MPPAYNSPIEGWLLCQRPPPPPTTTMKATNNPCPCRTSFISIIVLLLCLGHHAGGTITSRRTPNNDNIHLPGQWQPTALQIARHHLIRRSSLSHPPLLLAPATSVRFPHAGDGRSTGMPAGVGADAVLAARRSGGRPDQAVWTDVGSTTPRHRRAAALSVEDTDDDNDGVDNNGGGLWQHGRRDPVVVVVDNNNNNEEDDSIILSGVSVIASIVALLCRHCCCCCHCWSSQALLPSLPLPRPVITAAVVATTATLHDVGEKELVRACGGEAIDKIGP